MSSSIPMLLVMLLAHAGKGSNSRSRMFSKTGALKNFAIFKGKNLCWSLFLIKFQDWKPAFLFLLQRRCFSVNIAKFLRAAFLLKTCSSYNCKFLFDNSYFRVVFYYCKIRPPNRKNFAIDRSKFVFRYLIISLLQRFVSSSNCKEKMVALNWTILVSNFSKYIYSRSSYPEVFCWKGVLKEFAEFIGKQLCQNLLF